MTLSAISPGILLPVTMAACLSCAVLKNHYGKRISSSPRGLHLYNLVSFAVCSLLLFLYAGCRPEGSLYTVLIGGAFGAVTALSSAFELAALSIGPMSYTVVLVSSSTVITALSGLFFGESISVLKWVGIFLMMICLMLSGMKKDGGKEEKKASLKWLFLSVLAALFTASVGLLQKIHQESPAGGELTLMLLVAFTFSTLLSLVLYLAARKKNPPVLKRTDKERLPLGKTLLCLSLLIAAGLCVTLNNVINLHLVGVMDSAVFFPLVGGGHLILTSLVGLLLFKEKLSRLQWVGLICGIAATFCLCF